MLPRPESNGEPRPHTYPITQQELAEYRQLDGAIRRQLDILSYRRGQIIAGMGGMDIVEPGPLKPVVTYRNTGTWTENDEGDHVEVIQRHLTIVEAVSPDSGRVGKP